MSTLQRLLTILNIALGAAGSVIGGPIGAGIKLVDALEQIALHAATAYQAESGQPINLDKIPREDPVP